MKLDTVNRVNSSQLEKLLSASLETRWAMPDDRLPAVMIWGPPGAGKSAIVRSVQEAGTNGPSHTVFTVLLRVC